jgi:hypothetical protein
MQTDDQSNPGWAWVVFAISALAGIAIFLVPLLNLGSADLAAMLRHRATLATFAATVICIIMALGLWEASPRPGRVFLTVGLVLTALCAILVRFSFWKAFHQ